MITKQKPKEAFVFVYDTSRNSGRTSTLESDGVRLSLIVLILFSVFSFKGFAQADTLKTKQKNYFSISANYQHGTIMPTTEFVKGENLLGKPMQKYQAYTVKMLCQNPGYTNWQKIYHMPYYGVGLTIGDFYNPKEVGYPVSTFGILGIPVLRWNKLELYSEFQFGIASNWKHYDSLYNSKNRVVGGFFTVHLNLGVNALYHITDKLDAGAGISFVHFSNGGFERPNNGFNIYSPSVELKYHFSGRPDAKSVKPPSRQQWSNDLFFMMGYGDYQLPEHELDTNYFAVGGLSAIYFTQFSNAFRLGYGSDLNYWWGLNARPDGTPGPYALENLTLGLLVQPEFMIDKLSLVGGFGIYALHRNYGNFRQTYQRLGVRYEVYKNMSVGVNIRAINFMLAEFLEFNVGYRIKWMK